MNEIARCPEILPCPFCGAKPHTGSELMESAIVGDLVHNTMVTCLTHNCPANKVWAYVHAWNTRSLGK